MKITLLVIGKTEDQYLKDGIAKYLKRLSHYISFALVELPELKGTKHLSEAQQKTAEAELVLRNIRSSDHLVLLDERGKEFTSMEFSAFIEKKMVGNVQHLVFIVGGPYGFDKKVHDRADGLLSLSKLTFSHQMVRLFFVEQVYRAFTIMKNEPYHHQ
jgi:23S rRNA (pseudouridine1915-N3)-methyltransferase